MKREGGARLVFAAWMAAGHFAGCELAPRRYQSAAVRSRPSDWSNRSLNMMIDKYGAPARIEAKRVVWEKKGPWKRIAVWDEMEYRETGLAADNIEQTISYSVPEGKRDSLEALSGRVRLSADGSELSARSSSEELNILALNLADEIVRGARDLDDAKSFYAATVRLGDAGRSSPYMRGLRFLPAPGY